MSVTTRGAWMFSSRKKMLVKPLGLSTWTKSVSQDSPLGIFWNRVWSKHIWGINSLILHPLLWWIKMALRIKWRLRQKALNIASDFVFSFNSTQLMKKKDQKFLLTEGIENKHDTWTVTNMTPGLRIVWRNFEQIQIIVQIIVQTTNGRQEKFNFCSFPSFLSSLLSVFYGMMKLLFFSPGFQY